MATVKGSQTEGEPVQDSPTEEKSKEQLYKVLVIGDFGVDVFSLNYKLTIGVDFSLKTLQWSEDTKISLQLWDIAGHERFWQMTRVYYKYAIAAIIVFDLTRQVTFDSVLKWLKDVNEKVVLDDGKPIPVLLLANKNDSDNIQVDSTMLDDFCSEHSMIGWFPTSAKENTNITEAIHFLVEKILELAHREAKPDNEDFVDLGQLESLDSEAPFSSDSEKNSSHGEGYSDGPQIKRLLGLSPNGNDNRSPMSSTGSCAC